MDFIRTLLGVLGAVYLLSSCVSPYTQEQEQYHIYHVEEGEHDFDCKLCIDSHIEMREDYWKEHPYTN